MIKTKPTLENVQKVLDRYFSEQELLEIVSSIYSLNRIQGSSDLEKCAKIIAEKLREAGIDAKIREYAYNELRGAIPPVIGWDVEFGEAKLVKPREEVISSFRNAKTAVVAHSPPGEVEGEVVYVPSIDAVKSADVDGKIVLTHVHTRYAYFKCIERGARGFLFYRRNAPSNAVPYLGLFLKPKDVVRAKAPAISISRAWAQRLIDMVERGDKPVIKIVVKSRFREDAKIRVVEARIGEGSEEIHGVAHICHPGGTVNDNVSGAATLMETALALSRAIEQGDLESPKRGSMIFVWLPEYSGTLPYLNEILSEGRKPLFAVNLDMVGEKQCITNSTLIFIRSPNFMRSPCEALVYASLLRSLRSLKTFGSISPIIEYRFDISPYTRGSDHDLYLLLGVPAVMINQWPDRFYHTHLDSIDKLDPVICRKIGVAVGAAMYVTAMVGADGVRNGFRNVVEGYEELVQGLRKLSVEHSEEKRESIAVNEERRYRYVGKGLPSIRYFEDVLSSDELEKLIRTLEKDGFYGHLLSAYIPILLARRAMTISEIVNAIRDEYGEVEVEKVKEVLEVLKKANLVEVL